MAAETRGFPASMLVLIKGAAGATRLISAVKPRDVLANGTTVKAIVKSTQPELVYQVTRSTGPFLETTMHGPPLRVAHSSEFALVPENDHYSTLFGLPFNSQRGRVYVGLQDGKIRRAVEICMILQKPERVPVYRLLLTDPAATYLVRQDGSAVILEACQ